MHEQENEHKPEHENGHGQLLDMNTNMDKGANSDTKMALKDLDSDIGYGLKL
jgi:hypothetical protein